jgi:hypothetical protein
MNPGAAEEAGQTARAVITSLKESPLTLALVVFNLIFVLAIYLSVRAQRDRQAEFQKAFFIQQEKTMEMLYNCTPSR